MENYHVTGMSCAACSARIEKAVNEVPGVTACSVSLLTNSMKVDGTASAEEIIHAVENAGYGAFSENAPALQKNALEDTETPELRKRFLMSAAVLLPLLYLSMGHMMWGWTLPAFFEGNHIAMALAELLLSAVIMLMNRKFFVNGFRGLMHKSPNMDTLVAMGSGISFLWSVVQVFIMTRAVTDGDQELVMNCMMQLYFESAAMILTLITVGKMLEAHSKGKTTDALKGLMQLSPKTAVIIREGTEITVPAEQIQKGDIFIIRPGDSIPADGIVIEGNSAVDESALTGESIPADKNLHDAVSAGTINQSGYLKCQAVKVGEDTALSQIIHLVSDAAAEKAPIARIADKISGIFVPVVIGISILTFCIWLMTGQSIGYALERGISVLVISCPCALGLATPVAIMVGNGVGAKHGILFKTAVSLEETGKMQIAVLDKTGTITEGRPLVTDIIPENVPKAALLQLAISLEIRSEHPIAKAILENPEIRSAVPMEITDFEALPGNGLTAKAQGKRMYAGSLQFLQSKMLISETMQEKAAELAQAGKTPLFFAYAHQIYGLIAVADVIRKDSIQAIHDLQNLGLKVMMLTGDNEITAQAVGKQIQADAVIAGVLPEGKEHVIRKLQEQGKVMMIGDGINDAPALTRADIGLAIGAGTEIAIDAADAVLMKSSLSDAVSAVRLSRAVLTNIHENLFWAFIYNLIGIPLAAGAFIKLFGWELQPMFGAAAMSLSSFCVVTNALRLNFVKLHDSHHDRKQKSALKQIDLTDVKPESLMQDTLCIEGMMCPHCEATVKKVLESFPEVISAEPDHEKNLAILTLCHRLENLDEIKKAIAEKGYELLDKK